VRMEWTEAARAARRRACDDAVEPAASARFAAWLQDVLTRERGDRCGMLSTVHFLRESDGAGHALCRELEASLPLASLPVVATLGHSSKVHSSSYEFLCLRTLPGVVCCDWRVSFQAAGAVAGVPGPSRRGMGAPGAVALSAPGRGCSSIRCARGRQCPRSPAAAWAPAWPGHGRLPVLGGGAERVVGRRSHGSLSDFESHCGGPRDGCTLGPAKGWRPARSLGPTRTLRLQAGPTL
jgi:hypothetical protein